MFYGVPVWIIPGLLRAISAEALGTRLTRAQKVKPNMAEIEGILARHSQSPYVRGQQNFYVFLYFPSENLEKNR
jgi:hypothetical protein